MAMKQSEQVTSLSATEKGKHAELLVHTALLANGWTVMESSTPHPFDFAIKRPDDKTAYYIQVKTAQLRDSEEDKRKYNGEWLVVKGAKGNGSRYSSEEVDYFVAVWGGEAYMFPNEVLSEYWIRPSELGVKWTKLGTEI